MVQNYPKLKKIIHSQITQIKQKSIVYRITVRKWFGKGTASSNWSRLRM